MFRFYPISRFAVPAIAILVSLFSALYPAQAVDWSGYKMPGGVHHKTVFINFTDHPTYEFQGVASVCMSDKLSIKKSTGGGNWDNWAQYGDFHSTWGLDCAYINSGGFNWPYLVFSGDHRVREFRFYNGAWEEIAYQNLDFRDTDFHVQESVFYSTDGSTFSPDKVLICQTQMDEGEDNYGLWRWDGVWEELDDSQYGSSEGYGYRMWRNLNDGQIIYMTHEDPDYNKTIAYIEAIDINTPPTGVFHPYEVMNIDNLPPNTTVNQAPSFFQWKEGDDLYQYIVASTRQNGVNSIDVWWRQYENNSSDWIILIQDIDADLPLLEYDGGQQYNGEIKRDIALVARHIPDNPEHHRVYLATYEYGLTAYNTLNGTQTAVNLNNIEDEDNRLNVFKFRYLDICPFASTSAKDVVFYSQYSTIPVVGSFEWNGANIQTIEWDGEFYSFNSETGTDISGLFPPRECYIDNNLEGGTILFPGCQAGIFTARTIDNGTYYQQGLGLINNDDKNDANYNKHLFSIIKSPFHQYKYYLGASPISYFNLGTTTPTNEFPNLWILDYSDGSFNYEEYDPEDPDNCYNSPVIHFAAYYSSQEDQKRLYFSTNDIPIQNPSADNQIRVWRLSNIPEPLTYDNIITYDDGETELRNITGFNAGVTSMEINPNQKDDLIIGFGSMWGDIANNPPGYNNQRHGYLYWYDGSVPQLIALVNANDEYFKNPLDLYVETTHTTGPLLDGQFVSLVATASFTGNFYGSKLHDEGGLWLVFSTNGTTYIRRDITPSITSNDFNTNHPAFYSVECISSNNSKKIYCLAHGKDAITDKYISRLYWTPTLNTAGSPWWNKMYQSYNYYWVPWNGDGKILVNGHEMKPDCCRLYKDGDNNMYILFGNLAYSLQLTQKYYPIYETVGGNWNWVSVNVFLDEDNIKKITGGIEYLDRVANHNGDIYNASTEVDSTWSWNIMENCAIKVTDTSYFDYCGVLVPFDTTYSLTDCTGVNWNWISYMPEDEMSVSYAFDVLGEKVVMVKNDDGEWWSYPDKGTDFKCEPGEGYRIALTEDTEFSYPDPTQEPESIIYDPNGNPKAGTNNQIASVTPPSHFSFLIKTGDFQAIEIDTILINGEFPNVGDEIGVFTPNGLCVGAGVYEGQFPICFAGWKDDDATAEIDGYTSGDAISYILWDSEANIEIPLNCTGFIFESNNRDNPRIYEGSVLCGGNVEGTFILPEKYSLCQNYPNPFNPTTNIKFTLKWRSDVRISIYNLLGQEVAKLVEGIQDGGTYQLKWEGKTLSGEIVTSGLYFLKMKAKATEVHFGKKDSFERTIKMTILK